MSDDNMEIEPCVEPAAGSFCITENVFDEFQSSSMYQEDEFITLRDILPPQPEVPNLARSLDDFSDENEVTVDSSGIEEIRSIEDSHKQNETIHENQNQKENVQVSTINSSQNVKNKRGRKSKKFADAEIGSPVSQSDRSLDVSMNGQSDLNFPSNGLPLDTTNSDLNQSGRGKRQRKPRSTFSLDDLSSSTKRKQNQVFREEKSIKLPEQCPQPRKKRGRPKKTPVTYDEQPSSSAFQINDQLSSNTSLENTLPTPEKEVTLSEIKTSVESMEDDEDIDAPLSKRKKNRHSKGNKKQKNIECIENANIEREKSNLTAPEEVTCNDKELTDNDFTEIVEDDLDDLSLSQLKESLEEKSEVPVPEDVPITPDTTEIIQDIKEAVQKNNEILEDIKSYDTTLLEEKPKRARIKSRQYKEVYSSESEEDPYANVELSDDEPKRKRKGRKYYSDDEYVPSKEFSPEQSSDSASDNDVDELDDTIKNRRKNKPLVKSPKKGQKGAKKEDLMSPSVTTILPTTVIEDDDIEGQLQSSVILASDSTPKVIPGKWGNASEFESFLKKKIKGSDLKIKKVNNQSHVVVKALEIPSIDPTQAKKFVETSSQTEQASAKTVGVQTTSKDDLVMKQNVSLTEAQKRKACKFLTSIVKTTSELGQLMTEKSEDFIRKKINTGNVTDTFKMDYCVKKSYLLFKLAKHNLLQMEEDLAKQYEEFLKENNLSSYREPPKVVVAKSKPKTADNDSDCEIVEDKNEKPKFNPKTVFLNKELSIKIAKKPEEKTVKPNIKNIKGLKHTVWISDSVMVKKVKPTQSFLAQDSRTKKPPDSVLLKIVNDFFRDHNRREAVVTCAPFISKEWLTAQHTQICNYFFIKSTDVPPCESERFQLPNTDGLTINPSLVANCYKAQDNKAASSPKSLFTLCTNVLQKTLLFHTFPKNSCDESLINANKFHPKTLFSICTENLQKYLNAVSASEKEPGMDIHENRCNPETLFHSTVDDKQLIKEKENPQTSVNILNTFPVLSLKALCLQNVRGFFETAKATTGDVSLECEGFSAEEDFEDFDSISQCSLENDVETAKNKNTIFESVIKENTAPVLSLKALCLEKLRRIFRNTESKLTTSLDGNAELSLVDDYDLQASESEFDLEMEMNKSTGVKSLLTLCVEIIQKIQKFKGVTNNNPLVLNRPLSLRQISFETLVNIVYFTSETRDNAFTTPELTPTPLVPERTSTESPVKCVEITCLKTEPSCSNAHLTPDEDFSDDNFYGTEEYEPVYQTYEEEAEKDQAEDEHPETNWVSQVQMQISSVVSEQTESNFVESNHSQTLVEPISHIKVEPTEEITPLIEDSPAVKLEPGLNQMTIIHDSIIPKEETEGTTGAGYDVETFESFVRNNKMMRFAERYSDLEDESYTQSGLRIRRQHEPDYYNENDNNLSLLVPQTSEPFNIDIAKDTLMESSSDDESSVRKSGKKKTDRRPRGRPKKQPNREPTLSKEVVKNIEKGKSQMNTEIVALTRKMQEKIRQEEKKTASSESDLEDVPLSLRSERANKKTSNKIDKLATEEIQCNNIDSTEIDNTDKVHDKFTGFSAVDQCEISTYHKYAKFMYDKILEENSKPGSPTQPATQQHDTPAQPATQQHDTPIVSSDEPVEYLECEPSIPIMEDNENIFEKGNRNPSKNANVRAKTINKGQSSESLNFKMRDGWKCYPIDSNDIKLYSSSYIALEKLPNTFVNTYRHYQSFTKKDQDDLEIDKLTNLHSLKRLSTMKEKSISHVKSREKTAVSSNSGNVSDDSRTLTASLSDEKTLSASELSPSEDEDANIEDEPPPPVPKRDSENNQAKNLLMGDYGSDSDCPLINRKIVKKEPNVNRPHKRPGPKSKTVTVEHPENLMLTADKMMNKELALLHAPVNLDEDDPQVSKGEKPKIKHKSGSRYSRIREYVKNEEDSSSEEEKQWVTTKEKLLKRMVKKPEDTGIEDAKRAKLVSEFIERRSDKPDSRKRVKGKLRSRKKFLERQKQLKILSNELYGDQDTAQIGKRSAAYFKGRRNIRKVIDKKSLARSTVVANMEEFERKTRLIATQNRLRKELGCEEDVNVLVINDELCLEYDFEEKQPVVTVHPFFTKVMKAHQYEGVKFMWDACFESLQMIESGEPGGGCILAHCMGLGKTLQVLALLHTVLTHPRVGMQRVLVCCPLSTVLNWVDEIHKWIGPVTDQIKVFELSKLKKTYERAYQLEDWYNGGGIFIIGYELFRSLSLLDPELDDIRPTIVNKIRTALLDPGPDIIVCDEGHLLKNDCSVLAVAMSRVVTKRRIVLTGTPMQNNLREYYCMVNFVKPNLLGTYSEYSNRFENPIMNGQHRDSREEDIKLMKARTHILHKVLEGCLQRQEASVLYPYLPKKHEYTLFINLTDCQWDLYKHYMDNYSRGQKRQGVLKDFHILQKVWTHPQVLHNFLIKPRNETAENAKPKAEKIEDDLADEDINDPEYVKDVKPAEASLWWMDYLDNGGLLETLESSHKLEAVFRILDESVAVGDKMLIFSTSLYTLDTLEYFLKKINKWSLGKEYYRLDGSVPAEVRQKWCREFNAENNHKTKLFLISTRAGSLGLNLVAANRVIILDTSWNPAHDIQSIFRIYRFGQKKDCYIYRLVALGTMEQKIYERSVTKQAVACRVVDEQQIDRHYNSADLTELYRYDESGSSVAGGVAAGVRDVVLLRVARACAVHAAHEHDSLLRGSGEQGLDELERAAAWSQFQQEHEHKQKQNGISSSLSIHIPKKMESPKPDTIVPDVVKSEPGPSREQPSTASAPTATTKRGRYKKGGPVQKCNIPITVEPTEYDETDAIQNNILIAKITNMLIIQNYHTKVGKKISEVVELVRDIVKNNQLRQISKNMDIIAQTLSTALLAQPPNNARGRPPKKDAQLSNNVNNTKDGSKNKQEGNKTDLSEPPPTKVTEGDRTRRRAAVAAEKQLVETIKDSIIDIDDSWSGGSDHENPPTPPPPSKKTNEKEKPKTYTIKKTKPKDDNPKVTTEASNEISLLSDDDEPRPQIKNEVDSETARPKVPLHRSLLNNDNFIKIVAHTYLNGNPSLDEDAATLAAKYSTLKALKEIESTGIEMYSGPLYDIAVKVLGIEVLEKLHQQKSPPKETPPKAPVSKPGPLSKKLQVKELSKLREEVQEPIIKEQQKSSNSVKKSYVIKLPPQKLKPAPSTQTLSTAGRSAVAVVPVGMFSRSNSVSEECSGAGESESILPDDDVPSLVAIAPAAPTVRSRPGSKPLLINNVSAAKDPKRPVKRIVKVTRIDPTQQVNPSYKVINLPKPKAPPAAKPESILSDTICLDSDEEQAPAPGAAVPGPGAAPVPISLMAATPAALAAIPGVGAAPRLVPVAPRPAPSSQQIVRMLPPQRGRAGLVSSTLAAPLVPAPLYSDSYQPLLSQYNLISAHEPAPPTYSFVPAISVQAPYSDANAPAFSTHAMKTVNLMPVPPSAVPSHIMPVPTYAPIVPTPAKNPPPLVQRSQSYPTPPAQSTPAPSPQTQPAPPPQFQPAPPPQLQPAPPPQSKPAPPPESKPAPPPQSKSAPPSQAKPAPPSELSKKQTSETVPSTSAAVKKKTICKPGDILRIKENGEVEILNRTVEEIDDEPEPSSANRRSTRLKETTPINKPQQTKPDPPKPSKPEPRKPQVSLLRESQPKESVNKKKRKRIISSSSSSSDDDCRSASPDDNPLSILRDVVHIQAADDPLSLRKPPQNKFADKPKQITPTQTRQQNKTQAKPNVSSEPTRSTKKPVSSLNNESATKKQESKTVAGTSRNILISSSGQTQRLPFPSVDLTGGSAVQVTNVQKVVPSAKKPVAPKTAVEPKKRPITSNAANKKQKTGKLMTLADFDLDDFDDIIELE